MSSGWLSSKRGIISILILVGAVVAATWGLCILDLLSADFARTASFTTIATAVLVMLLALLGMRNRNGLDDELENDARIVKHDWLIATGIYTVITAIIFYPTLSTISSTIIGPPEDNLKYLWSMWWGKQAILGDASLSFSDYIFYPEGGSLLYNDYSWYNLGLSILLSPILGVATIYNLLIMHTFVLSGLGGFFLTRYFTRNSWVSLAGGFIFAFNPSHFAHSLHHMNVASIQFVPFFVLFFVKSVKSASTRDVVLAGLFFFLTALCDWNYLIFNCFFVALSYIYIAITSKRVLLPRMLRSSGAIVVVTLLLLSPWLVRMVQTGLEHPELNVTGHSTFVADIMALVVPHQNHPLGDIGFVEKVNSSVTGNPWESTVYLGMINVLLLGFVSWRCTGTMLKFLFGIVPFLILSMGSYMHFMGLELPVVLPYRLFEAIPFLSQARNPSRFIVFVYMFLGIGVAFALKHIYQSFKQKLLRVATIAAASIMIFLAFFSVNHAKSEVKLPECYQVIMQDESEFAVLDLPTSWKGNASYMMYQTMHGVPIVQGLVPRKIGRTLINNLETRDIERRKQQLVDNRVKYVVLHKGRFGGKLAGAIAYHEQAFRRIYSDEHQVVFQVY